MRRLLPLALAALLLGAFAPPADDEAAIRAAFDAYKRALLASDGQAALAVVDRNTVGYYGRMRGLALHGDAEAVRALPSLDFLMVLLLRHRLPPSSLRAMDGAALFAHGVEEGWIGQEGVANQTLGDIRIEADTAYADILVAEQPTPLSWAFHREGGAWRLDLTSTMGAMNEALDVAAHDAEMDREAFFFAVLGMVTGKPPDKTIWIPSDRR